MSSNNNTASSSASDIYDPNTFEDRKIKLVSNMFIQKMLREEREQRKLESQLYCKPTIHEFAMCVTNASLLAPFKCRSQHKQMVSCLLEYMDNSQLSVYKPNYGRDDIFNDITQRQSIVPIELQAQWNEEDLMKLSHMKEQSKTKR